MPYNLRWSCAAPFLTGHVLELGVGDPCSKEKSVGDDTWLLISQLLLGSFNARIIIQVF